MKVFVAGATGVLGKRAVRRLVGAGHHVTAVARGPEKAELLRSLGADPVPVDLFDPEAVKEAVAGPPEVAVAGAGGGPLGGCLLLTRG